MTVVLVNGHALGAFDDLLEADKACEWLECHGVAATASECPANPILSRDGNTITSLGNQGQDGVFLVTGEPRASGAAGAVVTLSSNRNKKE